MPFAFEWTDAAPEYLGRDMPQFHWRVRGALTPAKWELNFLVRLDGRVIGTQSLRAVDRGRAAAGHPRSVRQTGLEA